ncbi:PREDICTED: uncharacterized protein LOC104709520 [Camelina sativa]|uniref:Uncharacterized protein LOC104709520 n=1 Tax=Camelina sativa TaxID=90675 RepID=A0ABM0TCX9_CAMSA|nr:PREDICTED: uncharacterized protein LOC104709520 [Camelina sativa]
MNNYTLKNPTAIGREYMVLTHKTGITVDHDTSMIYASDSWWKDQEFGCKVTISLNRKPPQFWDVMQRCFILHDVQSQSQHSARQRREQLMNEHANDEEDHDDSDSDSGDIPPQIPVTQDEEEEGYHVTIDDDDTNQNSARRGQQRGRLNLQSTARRGSNSQRSGGSSRVSTGSGSRGTRRRQSFETTIQDTIAGYREFQRQSFQQLRPASSTDEDKLQLLETMTGVSRNNQDVPKQLGAGHSFGSPHSGGLSSNSPSSVGNNLGAQNSPGFWGPRYQQWGTPPNAPQADHQERFR